MRLIDADEAIARIDAKLNEMSTFTESEYGIMGYRNACVAFKRMLDSLPTVNEWIPVSERLPEMYERVLISVKEDGYSERIELGFLAFLAQPMPRNIRFRAYFNWYEIDDVLAWQPLPKPYLDNYGFASKEEADLWMDSKPVGKEEI